MLDQELERVAGWIGGARRVVYLCGAGLSVASGIKAYRSGPNALWSEYVVDWGTRARFMADPAAWWTTFWLGGHKQLLSAAPLPNPGHLALTRLCARKAGDLVITQNIDGLQRAAGLPAAQLIEIHGRHDRFVCASEGECAGGREAVEAVDLSGLASGRPPACARCGAPMRPQVLLFDEYYESQPDYQAHQARRALNDADLIVCVGTSFSVGITSSAIRAAEVSGARLVNINPEPAPFPGVTELRGNAEVVLPALADRLS